MQVTEADQEALEAIREIIREEDRAVWDGAISNVITRHRTASTAALMGENQRLREIKAAAIGARGWYGPCDDPDMSAALSRLDRALFTPSEVREPNPDEVAGVYSAFEVTEPEAIGGGEEALVEAGYGSGYEFYRNKWIGDHPGMIADLVRYFVPRTPQPVSGDAVREALEADKGGPSQKARDAAYRIVRDFRPAGWPAKEEEIARFLDRESTPQVREALATVEFPYQATFNAIGEAVEVLPHGISISVKKFQDSLRAALNHGGTQ